MSERLSVGKQLEEAFNSGNRLRALITEGYPDVVERLQTLEWRVTDELTRVLYKSRDEEDEMSDGERTGIEAVAARLIDYAFFLRQVEIEEVNTTTYEDYHKLEPVSVPHDDRDEAERTTHISADDRRTTAMYYAAIGNPLVNQLTEFGSGDVPYWHRDRLWSVALVDSSQTPSAPLAATMYAFALALTPDIDAGVRDIFQDHLRTQAEGQDPDPDYINPVDIAEHLMTHVMNNI